MKKIISIAVIACFAIAVYAQNDTAATTSNKSNANMISKRGVNILPEKGDLMLGVNANPILSYMGGIFSDGGATTPSFSSPNTGPVYGIMGKKMLANDRALRFNVSVIARNDRNVYVAGKDVTTPDPNAPLYVEDVEVINDYGLDVSIGIEKRRGHGRVQGFYGAELIVMTDYQLDKYNYGNPITSEFNNPTVSTSLFGISGPNGGRLIEDTYNNGLGAGVRAFVGVEYFFAPKISLSGEFGLSLLAEFYGNSVQTYEKYDGASQQIITYNIESTNNGYKDIGLSTDNNFGSIRFNFYF